MVNIDTQKNNELDLFTIFTENNNRENFFKNFQLASKLCKDLGHSLFHKQNKEGVDFIDWLISTDNSPSFEDSMVREVF